MEFDFSKSQFEMLNKILTYPNDFRFPVGTILTSEDESFNPETEYGGKWEQIKDRFLLGAGETFEAGSTGGEIKHLLKKEEIPDHTHTVYSLAFTHPGSEIWGIKASSEYSDTSTYKTLTTQSSDCGSQPHNNMPPYIAKFMWIKTKTQEELDKGELA